MTSVLAVEVDNVEEYVLHEAEALISKLGEVIGKSDSISMKLDRDDLLYQVLVCVNCAPQKLISRAASRDLKDAIEESFLRMLNLIISIPVYKPYQAV